MKAITARKIVTLSSFAVAMSFVLVGCGGAGANAGGPSTLSYKLATSYKMTTVSGPAGSQDFEIAKVSPNGVMAGTYQMGGKRIGFVFKNGTRKDVTPSDHDCNVLAVHDDGSIDGYYEFDGKSMPFTTKGGSFKEVPVEPGFTEGEIRARDGQGNAFIGYFKIGMTLAVKESGGQHVPLTVAGAAYTAVTAASPSGNAVGWCKVNDKYVGAMFEAGATVGTPIMQSSKNANLTTVNDLMSFGGSEEIGGINRAFVNVMGQHIILPSMPQSTNAIINGINAGNVAVGSDIGDLAYGIAWSGEDGFVDLSTRIQPVNGVLFRMANGIDDHGTIVGLGLKNGEQVGIILTPVN